jgi:hypothetical protein
MSILRRRPAARSDDQCGTADGTFAQQVLLGDVVGGADVTRALDDFAAETVDFISGHFTEVFFQRLAGFELFRVDQQGRGAECGGRARQNRWPLGGSPASF